MLKRISIVIEFFKIYFYQMYVARPERKIMNCYKNKIHKNISFK